MAILYAATRKIQVLRFKLKPDMIQLVISFRPRARNRKSASNIFPSFYSEMKEEQGWDLHFVNLSGLIKGEIACNSVEGQLTESMLKLVLRKCYVDWAGCRNNYFLLSRQEHAKFRCIPVAFMVAKIQQPCKLIQQLLPRRSLRN